MRDAKTIVLTGASGVVGRAPLTELAGRPVIALVHRDCVDAARSLRCDVSRERLGLDPGAYHRLARDAEVMTVDACVGFMERIGRPIDRLRARPAMVDRGQGAAASVRYCPRVGASGRARTGNRGPRAGGAAA